MLFRLLKSVRSRPDDTPYSGGCFVFDVRFQVGYPRLPPQVKLRTTGNSSVRFNPNLYNCGKVCLSLLGTWGGVEGEKWNEKTSTLLQVLVSIQSLILVAEPHFNEPGFETTMGTPEGTSQSKQYNARIRKSCIEWAMVDIMKHSPPHFAQVIKCHFKLKEKSIMQTVREWEKDDPSLAGVIRSLETEFANLREIKMDDSA